MAVPLSASSVVLLENCELLPNYQHTRFFKNKTAQLNFFDGKSVTHRMGSASFQRDSYSDYLQVNVHIDEIRNTDYMYFTNSTTSTKRYYCFVSRLEYINNRVTRVHFELDVLQTYMFNISFRPCMIDREHTQLWDSDGHPIINTQDEALDYGHEYAVRAYKHLENPYNVRFMVIASKETIHYEVTEDPEETEGAMDIKPSIIGVPQPLSFYLLPFTLDGSQLKVHLKDDTIDVAKPDEFLKGIYTNQSSVDRIVSIYFTEFIGVKTEFAEGSVTFPNMSSKNNMQMVKTESGELFIYIKKIQNFSARNLANVDITTSHPIKEGGESKLRFYPYSRIVVTNKIGDEYIYRPEYFYIHHTNMASFKQYGSIGLANKMHTYSDNYIATNGDDDYKNIAYGFTDTNSNDVPILTEYLASYIQGNKNVMDTTEQQIKVEGTSNVTSSIFNAISDIAISVATRGAGKQVSKAFKNVGKDKADSIESTRSNTNGIAQVANDSIDFYYNVQQFNAQKKDISNKTSTLVKSGSNSFFNIGNNLDGIRVELQTITHEYIDKLEDHFKMFGYKVGRIKKPNLTTRSSFNYVRTIGCKVVGDIDTVSKVQIQNIFDRGITLWHIDAIGDYSVSNKVVENDDSATRARL